MIPITLPEQDTCEHTTSDDLTQQLFCNGSIGHIAHSQPEMETCIIVNFNAEYSTDPYQQQINLPDGLSPPTPPSLVSNHNNAQLNTFTFHYT